MLHVLKSEVFIRGGGGEGRAGRETRLPLPEFSDLPLLCAVQRSNSSSSALSALLLLILMMTSSRLKKLLLTNLLSIVFNTRIVSNCCMECCVQRAHQFRSREDKKSLNLSFVFRPQTRCIQYFGEGLNLSFVSAFDEVYLDSFVPKHFQLGSSSGKLIDKRIKLT